MRAKLEALGAGTSGPTPRHTGLGAAPGGADSLHQTMQAAKRPPKGMGDPQMGNYLMQRLQEEMLKDPEG